MDAQFVRGENVLMINYTPAADIEAGQVVVVGDIPMVAHRPILTGELGALAISGGTYKMVAAAAITNGAKVWWDDTNNKVTTTASTHKYFGHAVQAAAADGDEIEVAHGTVPTSAGA